LPGLIELTIAFPCSNLAARERVVLCKPVQFSVVATADRILEWRYELDSTVKTGRTQTRLPALVARRVRWKIDAALRAKKPSPPSADSSAKSEILTT
jgi:hypothetical protein